MCWDDFGWLSDGFRITLGWSLDDVRSARIPGLSRWIKRFSAIGMVWGWFRDDFLMFKDGSWTTFGMCWDDLGWLSDGFRITLGRSLDDARSARIPGLSRRIKRFRQSEWFEDDSEMMFWCFRVVPGSPLGCVGMTKADFPTVLGSLWDEVWMMLGRQGFLD